MKWSIRYSRKAAKQYDKLPIKAKKLIKALEADLETTGPNRGNWPNYSKLGVNIHHCHLNRKGRPTWVAVWEVTDKEIKIIEVTYVGTREKAPY